MPVNRISNNAMRAMVDMMRDLMESVMDEAATYEDSNGRVIIDSGAHRDGCRAIYAQGHQRKRLGLS